MPGCIVPLFRCSATILYLSWISSCGRWRSLSGNDASAPGRSSIAWSQTVCSGSLYDCCLLNTFACQWNTFGTFDRSASDDISSLPIVTFAMK